MIFSGGSEHNGQQGLWSVHGGNELSAICNTCDTKFSQEEYLRKHKESVHRGNILTCMICDKQNVLVRLVTIDLTWTVCGECDSTFETRDLLECTWVWNLTKLLFKSEECGTTFKPKRIFSDSNFTGLQKDCLMKEWLQLMWKNFCRKLQN